MPKCKKSKKACWSVFSKYIRTRDCINTAKSTTEGYCVTCNRKFPIAELQAGHAIGGRNNSILFDEELVNAQCRGCNGYGNGRYADYSLWFINKHGIEKWEEKVRLSHQLAVDLDYDEIYDRFKNKLNNLLNV